MAVAMVGSWVLLVTLSSAPPAAPVPELAPDRAPAQPAPVLGFSRQAAKAPGSVDPPPTMEERARALDLVPLPGGGWVYIGQGSTRFSATIHADGTVDIDANDGFQAQLDQVCVLVLCADRRPKPVRGKNAKDRARWLAAQTRDTPTLGAPSAIAGTSGVNPWNPPSGDPSHDHSQLTPPIYPYASLAGSSGWLPYPSHAVSGFLDRTFEFRLDLVRAAIRERLVRQSARLPQDLLDVWRGSGTVAQRRAAVLEMWAELEPPHVDPVIDAVIRSDIDQERTEAADRARGTILEFTDQYAPAGSPTAFTDEELRRFNAKRDEAEQFWPYGR